MTSTIESKNGKLIHVAKIFNGGKWSFLFLRKNPEGHFIWQKELDENREVETHIEGQTIEEAMRLAPREWKNQSFTMLLCGFRYTLPERDEHGINALFHQMSASYAVSNGIYYDEELGNNCFVQNASQQAYKLWQRLKVQNRLS